MILEMQGTRPLYYFIVAAITQIVLIVAAILLIAPTGLLGHLPWTMISFLLLYNIFISTVVAVIIARDGSADRLAVLKGSGLVLGHLVGLILGGFVGAHYGGVTWAIGGAVILYFIGGWIGSRISLLVGNQLDRTASAALEPPSQIQVRRRKQNTSALFLAGAVIPLVLMVAAVIVRSAGLPITQYPQWLPAARILLALLSIFSIMVPWLRGASWLNRVKKTLPRESVVRLVGLALCLAPAVYGFLLFIAFDLSIAELSLFAAAASIATATWGAGRA